MELKFSELIYEGEDSIRLKEELDLGDVKVSIIHGSNGVGKSTLTKNIEQKLESQGKNTEIYSLETRNELNLISRDKDKLIIKPYFQEIANLKKDIDLKENEIDSITKNNPIGFTQKAMNKMDSDYDKGVHQKTIKDYSLQELEKFLPTEVSDIVSKITKKTAEKFFDSVQEYNKISEGWKLKLTYLENSLPYFNSVKNNGLINERDFTWKPEFMNSVDDSVDDIVDKIQSEKETIEKEHLSIYKGISNILDIDVSEYSDSAMHDFLDQWSSETFEGKKFILTASSKGYSKDKILESKKQLEEYQSELNRKIIESKIKIEEFKRDKNSLEELLKIFFEFEESIKYGEEEIVITLPRDVDSYSTGEQNLLNTLLLLKSFEISKDLDYLILDDPFSSYDTLNKGLIARELLDLFIKVAENNDKNILVLTHDIRSFFLILELISREELTKYCKIFSIDKTENKNGEKELVFLEINKDELKTFYGKKNLKTWWEKHIEPEINNYTFHANNREMTIEELFQEGDKKIFHYRECYIEDKKEQVRCFISDDNFSELENKISNAKNFTYLIAHKIIYVLALRIFMEEKIYQKVPENKWKELDNSRCQLFNKLTILFEETSEFKKYEEYLRSLSIQVNDSVHLYEDEGKNFREESYIFDSNSSYLNSMREHIKKIFK